MKKSTKKKDARYQGMELKRNEGIPADRYRAFDLPSRVGDKLYYPDGRVEDFPKK